MESGKNTLLEQLNFSGTSKAECQQFIREVRRLAFTSGKSRDDEWMADLAGASMSDDAFEWHAGLGVDVQGSWLLLQKAMLEKYSMGGGLPEYSKVPTPAQVPGSSAPASGPIAAASRLPQALEKGVSSRTGHIAIMEPSVPSDSVPDRWVAQKLGISGMFCWTTSKTEAAIVRYVPSTGTHDIHVLNTVGVATCLSLTAMLPDGDLAFASSHDAVVNAAAPGFDTTSISASFIWNLHYTATSVWSVSADGTLSAIVEGTPRRTRFGANVTSGNIYAPLSIRNFRQRYPKEEYKELKLVFKPLTS